MNKKKIIITVCVVLAVILITVGIILGVTLGKENETKIYERSITDMNTLKNTLPDMYRLPALNGDDSVGNIKVMYSEGVMKEYIESIKGVDDKISGYSLTLNYNSKDYGIIALNDKEAFNTLDLGNKDIYDAVKHEEFNVILYVEKGKDNAYFIIRDVVYRINAKADTDSLMSVMTLFLQ